MSEKRGPNPASGHLVQMDIAWEDREANYARVEALLASAPIAPGDLIVLPEMFDTGFSFNIEHNVDSDGATRTFLRDLAVRTGATVHGSCTAIGGDDRGRNRVVVFAPDGDVIAQYDKIHPFSFGREVERFSGGDEIVTYDWDPSPASAEVLCVCPAICYDLRFPELFRLGMRIGAEAYAIGANWPAERAAHWRALLIARAIENQAFVVGVNRCGGDPHLKYAGGSMVVDPQGRVLAEADGSEQVLSARVDAAALSEWRERFPAWRDMRLRDLDPGDEDDETLGMA